MIISPAHDLPLPSDMQKALNEARNAVTLSEVEHRRLVELRVAEEIKIVELSKRKVYEEEVLQGVLVELSQTQDRLSKLKREEGVIMADIRARQDQIKQDELSIQTKKETLQIVELDFEKRIKELEEGEKNYSIKYAELCKEKEENNRRVSILNEALSKL